MKTRNSVLHVLVLVGLLAALLMAVSAQAAPNLGYGGPGGGGGGGGGRGGGSTGPLADAEKTALNAAIHEEYLARNTYLAVIAEFGSISPFSNIAQSEAAHAGAVANLLTKYGLPIPPNTGLPPGAPNWWPTRQAACQRGVDVELEDIALYDGLLPTVQHGDIIQVFTNLRSASINNHLPAFDACN